MHASAQKGVDTRLVNEGGCAAPVCRAYKALYKSLFGESAKADSAFVSYRAPHKGELPVVLSVGFQPENYPGDGVYLSTNALEVGRYANAYGAGALVVSTPLTVMESLISGGHVQLDALVPGAFNVLPSGIPEFNQSSSITHVPAGSFELYDKFGAQ